MLTSTIQIDLLRSYVVRELADRARLPADVGAIQRAFEVADSALGEVERAAELDLPDLVARCARGYLAALVLARTLDCVPVIDRETTERVVKFRRTALRMLVMFDAMASAGDRALRARVLADEVAPPVAVDRA